MSRCLHNRLHDIEVTYDDDKVMSGVCKRCKNRFVAHLRDGGLYGDDYQIFMQRNSLVPGDPEFYLERIHIDKQYNRHLLKAVKNYEYKVYGFTDTNQYELYGTIRWN